MDLSERLDHLSSDLTEQLVDPHYDSASDNGDVVGVIANCWAGSMSDKPTDATGDFDHNSDRAFEAQVSKPSNNMPWSVSDTVDTSSYSGYACKWAYEVSDASEFVIGDEDHVAHVHRDQDLEDELRNNFGENDFPEESFP